MSVRVFAKSHDFEITIFADTDSLFYEVRDTDVYRWIKDNPDFFDTSNYREDNDYDIPRINGAVPLKLKDELGGVPALEFVGLRAKQYAFRRDDGKQVKKSKGVQKNVVARNISFDDYKQCLLTRTASKRTQQTINSRLHRLYTVKRSKTALNSEDDKRVEIEDFNTLPYGHYSLGKK